MTDKHTATHADAGNARKDPDNWVTGDEPMTGAQRSYLKMLSEETHVEFDENLTKAEASRRIVDLQQRTGRGQPPHPSEEMPAPTTAPGRRSEDMGGLVDEIDFDGSGDRSR